MNKTNPSSKDVSINNLVHVFEDETSDVGTDKHFVMREPIDILLNDTCEERQKYFKDEFLPDNNILKSHYVDSEGQIKGQGEGKYEVGQFSESLYGLFVKEYETMPYVKLNDRVKINRKDNCPTDASKFAIPEIFLTDFEFVKGSD